MVHFPSKDEWQEILSTPHMVRLTEAHGEDGLELTLIARCSTLEIKYITQNASLTFVIFKSKSGVFCYGIVVKDDPIKPMVLWAACRSISEFSLVENLKKADSISIHLYNEACVNVASSGFSMKVEESFADFLENPQFEAREAPVTMADVREPIERLVVEKTKGVIFTRNLPWQSVDSHLIGERQTFNLNLQRDEEGGHQEQLAGWLASSVNPDLIELNLKCKEPKGESEFADVTMSYAMGTIIFESKALAFLTRNTLPPRKKLSHDIDKKIRKAARQLGGGCKTIISGRAVYNENWEPVEIERKVPPHAICLIPDLSLVLSPDLYATDFCEKFKKNGGMFHLMDIPQLYRMVQAAQMISAGSARTAMECFDAYLVQRFDIVMQENTVVFDMAIDLQSDTPRIKVSFGH